MAGYELLTTSEMAEADRRAVDLGVASLTLMENAGRAVADEAVQMVQPGARIAVLCGPGNNGGDGFVAARHLAERGYDVRVACLVPLAQLKGDAAVMAGKWSGDAETLSEDVLAGAHLIIDALFGAGLTRPLAGAAAQTVEAANISGIPILAVDVPSGLDGNTGLSTGLVIKAHRTITFFRKKPGHLLMPGRALCAEVTVAVIGIPVSVLDVIKPEAHENAPTLWLGHIPWPNLVGHKYQRGHAVVVSGPPHATGAARLGARGALRIGAGLVTVASPLDSVSVNAAHLTAIQIAPFDGPRGLGEILSDERKNAVLIGPAAGVSLSTRLLVQVVLEFDAAVVLDADALTSFTLDQDDDAEPVMSHLFTLIRENAARPVVITPHEGEFKRLFPDLTGSKLDRARAAAVRSGAIVVLKGADTVVASPTGRACINTNAPPWLATAGSGDVLAGFVAGLLAQKMPAFEASCAAVWLHGEVAGHFGPGLIAEDLTERLPEILGNLHHAAGAPGWIFRGPE